MLGSVTARAEAQAMRLAMLYALLDGSSLVRREHLLAGLACWDYALASARYVFGDALGDADADALWQALMEHPEGMTRNEIYEHFGKHNGRERLNAIIATLRASGRVRVEREMGDGRAIERVIPLGEAA